MKSSQSLISALSQKKIISFDLDVQRECQRLKILLPLSIKAALLGIYLKKDTIFFVFENLVVCNEFNKYHTKKLQKALQEYAPSFPLLERKEDLKFQGYVPKNRLDAMGSAKQNAASDIIYSYPERALGYFKNHCNPNSKRYEILESIRGLIIKNSDPDYVKL